LRSLGSGLVITLMVTGLAGAARNGTVTVKVSGIEPARGGTIVALLQNRDQFLDPTAWVARDTARASSAELTLTFPDVRPGDYAITLVHDTNGNGAMDYANDGSPLEGYAIPGVGPLDHMPSFDEVKVTVPDGGVTLDATMTYWYSTTPDAANQR
jgi:uncharacterized protein (DUF2141 family)